MLDLPSLILNLRQDLAVGMKFGLAANRLAYLSWLLTDGVREYPAIHDDQHLKAALAVVGTGKSAGLTLLQSLLLLRRPDVAAAFPLPAKRADYLNWFYTHGVEECGIWPFLSAAEQQQVLDLPAPWPARLQPVIKQYQAAYESEVILAKRKFGVNLVGYAFGQLGIGEDLRMAGRALQAAKVPMCLLDFPPGADIPQNEHSMATHVRANCDYSINMFCLTAEETGRYYAERGGAQFRQRYNIGYWPWELPNWPEQWEMMLELVDEVWVSTQHTYDALKPVCHKPLFVMPMAVHLGPVLKFKSREQARLNFRLPPAAKLFCFAFDLNSSMARKNPQACLDAFLQAFPVNKSARSAGKQGKTSAEVGLVIKVSKPAKPNKAWDALKAQAAKDPRIHIIERTLQRPELLALYQACDCFLSLHRAEGFGRGLAEALQLGLHVISTGYSGNVDFCKPPHADLVRYKLVKVGKQDYVHTEGQHWAEPDVAHAAELMRQFVEAPPKVKPNVKPKEWKQFSVEEVGKRYQARLLKIAALIRAGNTDKLAATKPKARSRSNSK